MKHKCNALQITYLYTPKVVIAYPTIINHVCVADDNECETMNGGCEHTCSNEPGSFTCSCRAGYDLQADQISCAGTSHH